MLEYQTLLLEGVKQPDLGEVLPFWHGLDTNPLYRTVMEGFLKQQLPRLGVDPDTARSESSDGGMPGGLGGSGGEDGQN